MKAITPMSIDRPEDRPGEVASPWYKKLAWFVALWAAGVLVVTTIGYFIRWWLV